MMKLLRYDVRELAWTVAGALTGSLARHWADPVWPGTTRTSVFTFILTLASAALVGFALLASIRRPLKTVLVTAGGAAGSVSVMATRAASATPADSIIGLAASSGGAVVGLPLGMWLASFAANHQRKDRC